MPSVRPCYKGIEVILAEALFKRTVHSVADAFVGGFCNDGIGSTFEGDAYLFSGFNNSHTCTALEVIENHGAELLADILLISTQK